MMSRSIFAFALVISFLVGSANGQDAKKPGQPKLVAAQAPAGKPSPRPASANDKRRPGRGHAPVLAPPLIRHAPAPGRHLPAMPKPKPVERKREVVRLSNSPAMDVAKTINEMLKSERGADPLPTAEVVLVPDIVSNSIIISAVPEAVKEIVELIKELDAPPRTVVIRVLMAEIVSEGKTSEDVILDDLSAFVDGDKKGTRPIVLESHEAALAIVKKLAGQKAVKILVRSQVATLDNQSAYVQIGGQIPRATSVRGDEPVGIAFEAVGLILGVTPRINSDDVVTMEIDFEKSDPKAGAGDPLAASIEMIRVQTTVAVPDGQTQILGGIVAETGNQKREVLMVVTPQIVAAK